ncbi:hypothetical protein EV702DRAFT_460237 [Suillus placidus]|uniref:Uncharacterized protein n=1 Tax=Suillus placidus TaxID=48579 RepID=A0A9P7D0K5_9AGAM|nr:hypothetical protein EV702DRAFT_460237 [Suillus placidus]
MNAFFTHEISDPLRNPSFPCLHPARRRATDLLNCYYTNFYLLFVLFDTSNAHFYHHVPFVILINFYSITPSYMMSTRTALSDAALSDLARKLRYANARYGQIACRLRCRITITRTYHAQRRAFWSGLRIDIAKAKDCPSTAISVMPLPVLDTTPSPSPLMLSPLALAAEAHNGLGLEIPDIVVSLPNAYVQPRKRLVIRIPPLASLHDDMYRHEPYDMSAPGAPLIRTKELPECEMDEIYSSRSCEL